MNANTMFNAVMELDLDPIKTKLMHVASGEGWSREKADAVEKEYRRFLCLMKMYPDEETAPMADVDTFWHYHILDTMKYARDCEQAFGYFLHHYPYVGMRGEDDAQFRIDSGERMRALYEATFGDTYPAARTDVAASAWCAGPTVEAGATRDGTGTAWCAGPTVGAGAARDGQATAWCAGPTVEAGAARDGTATAWCAGPTIKAGATRDGKTTAWCAGPTVEAGAARDGKATAWCAGPTSRRERA